MILRKGVPEWYVESMRKVRHLTSKAHTAHNVKTAVTLAWFKTYFPTEFYNVTLRFLEAENLLHCTGNELSQKLQSFEKQTHYKESDQEAIELLLEARQRNIPVGLPSLYDTAIPVIL
jgi:DNA polymerase III alpha subunit (gram-positive type)